jgi:hypothetical protein
LETLKLVTGDVLASYFFAMESTAGVRFLGEGPRMAKLPDGTVAEEAQRNRVNV